MCCTIIIGHGIDAASPAQRKHSTPALGCTQAGADEGEQTSKHKSRSVYTLWLDLTPTAAAGRLQQACGRDGPAAVGATYDEASDGVVVVRGALSILSMSGRAASMGGCLI